MLAPINLSFLTLFLFLLIFIFFLACNNGRLVAAGQIFIYAACSQEKYQPNTPYEANLNSLLSSIAASSSQSLYNLFAVGNSTDSAAYGLYQCRGDLKPKDCSACVAGLLGQAALLCPYTSGASLQLDGCFVRYEETDFLGRADDGLRFKKCRGGGDGEIERRRDDVLADLQGEAAAAAGYRVRAEGAVEGYAQCLGDLTAAECGECLGEAVAEVKRVCGAAAAAGEVFLAQCYVRYWESGYYDSSTSDSTNRDDVGRTVAIIVGIIVGVAFLIVLLSICKKALRK